MTDSSVDDTIAGIPNFPPPQDIPELDGFWNAVERGCIALPACPTCGVWQWYPLAGRPCGHAGELEWRDLSGHGTIFTFTRVERSFLPSGSNPPYTVALVVPDEAPGVRLVTVLVGPGCADPVIGDRVTLSPTEFETHTLPTFSVDAH